jgi:hypothetical protein
MNASSPTTTLVPTDEAAPFDSVYFETVFLVPRPPATWPRRFAIVTAHNPDGQLSSEHANNEYGRELHAFLDREGIESFAVVGASADLRHHEAGRGFEADDLAQAAAISSRFRQRAFFWVHDGVVYLCADASGKAWKVGLWTERLARR